MVETLYDINLLEAYLNATSDIVYLKDLDGRYVKFSPSVCKLFGFKDVSELIGKTDLQIFNDYAIACRRAEDDQRIITTGEPQIDYLEGFTDKKIGICYFLTSKYLLKNADGKISGIMGVSRDVTTLYKAQENYTNEIHNLFTLEDNAYGVVLFDVNQWRVIDMRFKESSEKVVTKYPRIDEYIQSVLPRITNNQQAYDYFSNFNKAKILSDFSKGSHFQSFEYLRLLTDGTKRWVRDEIRVLSDPISSVLAVSITLFDIDNEKTKYQKLVHDAEHDSVTGLLNRKVLFSNIRDFLSHAKGMHALFIIDLDDFKKLNDTFGHQFGDKILWRVGESLKTVFSSNDIIGRLGGDEFMVLYKDVLTKKQLTLKSEELISALQFSSRNTNSHTEITSSVGVTLFGGPNKDFNILYQQADRAMYEAKKMGKNRCCLFDPDIYDDEKIDSSTPIKNIDTVQLSTLLQYMDGGVIMGDTNNGEITISYVSPSLFKQTQAMPKSPQRILDFVHPDDLNNLQKAFLNDDYNPFDYEFRYIYAGVIKWMHLRIKFIPDSYHRHRRFVAVANDITELHNSNQQLEETDERYRIAIAQTEAMLWEFDGNSHTLKLNGPGWKVFHQDKRIFTDAPESYLETDVISPDSKDEFLKMFEDISSGIKKGVLYFKVFSLNREELWLKCQYEMLTGENTAVGIVQVLYNIGEEMKRYTEEVQLYTQISDFMPMYLDLNLTKDFVEHAVFDNENMDTKFKSFNYKALLEHFIASEDQKEFKRRTDPSRLRLDFIKGEDWICFDFYRIGFDKKHRFTDLLGKIIRHPITLDIHLFAYMKDNEFTQSWIKSYGKPLQFNPLLQIFNANTTKKLCEYIIKSSDKDCLASVSVIALLENHGLTSSEQPELITSFFRYCRIIASSEEIYGQLDENHLIILNPHVISIESQRMHLASQVSLLRKLMDRSMLDTSVSIVSGYDVSKCENADYSVMLEKAYLACRSAAQVMGEAAVSFVDYGPLIISEDDNRTEMKAKIKAMNLKYQQQANLLQISERDPLTGLHTKTAFLRYTREILDGEPGLSHAIVRFDIDRFKVYNEIHNTVGGDKLLLDIASILKKESKSFLLCSRFNSDHFVLLSTFDKSLIESNIEAMRKKLNDYSPHFHISISVGVYPIEDSSIDVSIMCDRALLALQKGKGHLDSKLIYYSDELRKSIVEEQQLINDFDSAIANKQFVIHFQPQVDFESTRMIGAEALVRWDHPQKGLLAPGSFIPLFEKNGLITKLDLFVWEETCKLIKHWKNDFKKDISISVNVSRIDLYELNISSTFKNLVEKYGILPSQLRLEITESAFIGSRSLLSGVVDDLQKTGFIVEMDDFGSGYSSLNTLKNVNVDVLKLDMKFLEDFEDSSRSGSILSSVIRMAHWLSLPIIAEGVETLAQATYLKSLGCVFMQGYFFSKPIDLSKFEQLLLSRKEGSEDFINYHFDSQTKGMAEFWDSNAQQALLFNSFLGGASIMEFHDGMLESSRANDNFFKVLGTTRKEFMPVLPHLIDIFDENNKKKLLSMLDEAIDSSNELQGELVCIEGVGGITRPYINCRFRLLATHGRSRIFYFAIEDITDRKQIQLKLNSENQKNMMLMEATGIAVFDYYIDKDLFIHRIYKSEKGIVKTEIKDYLMTLKQHGLVDKDYIHMIREAVLNISTKTSGQFEYKADFWNRGIRWCMTRYLGIPDENGIINLITGQIYDIQDIKEL